MSERDIIAVMARVLVESTVDLGDESAVEAILGKRYRMAQADIDEFMHAAMDRARALLAHAEEMTL